MKTQIPIYRAKKIDGDEYVQGFLLEESMIGNFAKHRLLDNNFNKIDQSTLSIHMPDMLDSKGNKIFASLSEDGKGGDIAYNKQIFNVIMDKDKCSFPLLFSVMGVCVQETSFLNRIASNGFIDYVVVGIKNV